MGSFVGATVWRIKNKKKISKGRSFCPSCKKKLGISDLFPIFSFIFLRGKCRYCNKKISWHYFVSEILTAVAFTSVGVWVIVNVPQLFSGVPYPIWNWLVWAGMLACVLGMIAVFALIAVYDLWYMEVPEQSLPWAYVFAVVFAVLLLVTLNSGTLVGFDAFDTQIFTLNLLTGIRSNLVGGVVSTLAGGLIMFLFFFGMNRLTKGKGMGFGDVVFAPAVGIWLGGMLSIVALLFSFVLGSFVAVIWALTKFRKIKGVLVPYLPFLCASAILVFLFSSDIMNWWINYLYLW